MANKNSISPIFLLVIASGGIGLYLYYKKTIANGSFIDFLNDLATKGSLVVESTITQDFASRAASFIANQEQFSSNPYPDPPGQSSKYSIGYGHQITGTDGLSLSSVIDQPTGLQLLSSDIGFAISCVESYVEVPITDNQKLALVDFTYNLGCGAFRSSTLLKLLNSNDYAGAAGEFERWVYANGVRLQALADRRSAEQELFLS